MARPSTYSADAAAKICAQLTEGMSLRKICAQDGFPDAATVFRWLGKHEEFREQYALARAAQADTYADEIVDIADSEGDPAKARVRVDARKWVASKLKPKAYGDKVLAEHTGADGGPLVVEIVKFGADTSTG